MMASILSRRPILPTHFSDRSRKAVSLSTHRSSFIGEENHHTPSLVPSLDQIHRSAPTRNASLPPYLPRLPHHPFTFSQQKHLHTPLMDPSFSSSFSFMPFAPEAPLGIQGGHPTGDASLPSQPYRPRLLHPFPTYIQGEDHHTLSMNPSFPSLIQYGPAAPLIGIHRRAPNPAQVNTDDLQSGEREDSRKHIWGIFDELELEKHTLSFAVPLVVSTVLASYSLSSTPGMGIVTVAASCSIAAIWNGLLFRKTCRKLSTIILAAGAALMMLVFFLLVSCYAPPELKWVPYVAWIATLLPFILPLLFFHRMSAATTDLLRGRQP